MAFSKAFSNPASLDPETPICYKLSGFQAVLFMPAKDLLYMPIYEFECRRCHHIYEQIMGIEETDEKPVCPKCGATNPKKLLGSYSFHSRQRYENRLSNRMASRAHGK